MCVSLAALRFLPVSLFAGTDEVEGEALARRTLMDSMLRADQFHLHCKGRGRPCVAGGGDAADPSSLSAITRGAAKCSAQRYPSGTPTTDAQPMLRRVGCRRRRRSANLRYRARRFANRHPEPCVVCGRNARQGQDRCRACTAAGARPQGPGCY